KHGINTFAAGQFFDRLDVVLLFVVDAMLQSECADAGKLILRRRCAIHFHPENFPDLHGSGADSSSNRMNEDPRACWLVDKARFPEREVGGEEIDREGSALLGRPGSRDGPKQCSIGSGLLSKGSPL